MAARSGPAMTPARPGPHNRRRRAEPRSTPWRAAELGRSFTLRGAVPRRNTVRRHADKRPGESASGRPARAYTIIRGGLVLDIRAGTADPADILIEDDTIRALGPPGA